MSINQNDYQEKLQQGNNINKQSKENVNQNRENTKQNSNVNSSRDFENKINQKQTGISEISGNNEKNSKIINKNEDNIEKNAKFSENNEETEKKEVYLTKENLLRANDIEIQSKANYNKNFKIKNTSKTNQNIKMKNNIENINAKNTKLFNKNSKNTLSDENNHCGVKFGNLVEKEKKEKGFDKFNKNKFGLLYIAVIFCFVSIFSVLLSGGFSQKVGIKVDASLNMLRAVQARLTELGYYSNGIDGVYDNDTQSALVEFQKNNQIVDDGEINDITLTALGVSTSEQANNELYLLAKLIYSEARGEVYTGQVAVGAVVLNRVDDAGFPNTLQGVIYQPWAFTALHDGQFGLEPNSTAYQAAQDALNGWDPSYGSLYYYNPNTATSSWIFTRTTVVVIGNHVFAI